CNPLILALRAPSERLHHGAENVSDSTLGPDDARGTRIRFKLPSQPQYLDVDAAVENVLMDPGGLQQLLPAQGPLGSSKERQQQSKLALRESHQFPGGVGELSASPFKLPAVEPVAAALGIARTRKSAEFLAPQHRANTCKQLAQSERLGDVVV